MKKMRNFIFLFLSVLFLAGCGSGNKPISGTVTYTDDGTPVSAGTVVFDDGKSLARGTIQPDGKYVMGFDKATNGVPPGEYTVAIAAAFELLPNPDNLYPPPSVQLIDPKYADKNTSGMTFTVDGKQRVFDIQVDRAKPADREIQVERGSQYRMSR